jgi:AcrR family transcriptional regulator
MSKKFSRTHRTKRPATRRAAPEEGSEPRVDRRVQRSHEALQRAFLALIVDEGYDAVTVRQICAKAGVSRATFYAHFKDKADVKRKGILSMKHQLAASVDARVEERQQPFAFSRALFEHAAAHLGQHQALAGSRGGRIAHEALHVVVSDLVKADLARRGRESPGAVAYYTGALLGVLTWWLERGAKPSAQEADRLFRLLAT